MNILFLSRSDPRNINNWSGTLYYIYNKLKEMHHVEIMGTELLDQLEVFVKGNFLKNSSLSTNKYIKNLNRILSERINLLNLDLVFFGDLLFVPFLTIDVPIVYLSDITYDQLRPHYIKPDVKKDERCTKLEKLMLENVYRIIYTSEWIKENSVSFYDIDPDKIDIVELGANIPTPQNYSIDINMDICRLVFIGRDWKRKGGDKVLQTYKKLKEIGFPCMLTIIGSVPEEVQNDDTGLTVIPFLDKSKQEHAEKLENILSISHFLFLPTQFDAYGIVFCEASAYALPSITADVGGVSQPIKEGKNGFLLPAEATADDYAEKIRTVFSDKENYIKLRASSRHEFETRLNWDIWGERVNKILEDAVTNYKNRDGKKGK